MACNYIGAVTLWFMVRVIMASDAIKDNHRSRFLQSMAVKIKLVHKEYRATFTPRKYLKCFMRESEGRTRFQGHRLNILLMASAFN